MKRGRSMVVHLDDVAGRLARVPHRPTGWMLSWRRYALVLAVLPPGRGHQFDGGGGNDAR